MECPICKCKYSPDEMPGDRQVKIDRLVDAAKNLIDSIDPDFITFLGFEELKKAIDEVER